MTTDNITQTEKDSAPILLTTFPLGHLVITSGASDLFSAAGLTAGEVIALVQRHAARDWGEVDSEDTDEELSDWTLNDRALNPDNPSRIVSAYTVAGSRVWIITEWDRSSTTVLLPSEY